ncbi:MAG: Fe-S protein assembly co-chaperone HscB [Planctomycetota bacterium]
MSARRSSCPGCGEPLLSTLACLACGRVLDEPADADHFARLGLAPGDAFDLDEVETRYLRLSRALHPDFHGRADAADRERVNRHTALLNEAWNTLADDTARAEYRLGLLDPDALERHKQLDPAFLMEAMELSEESEHCDAATRDRLIAQVQGEIARRGERLAEDGAWSPPDTAELAVLLHEMRVYKRILRDLEIS